MHDHIRNSDNKEFEFIAVHVMATMVNICGVNTILPGERLNFMTFRTGRPEGAGDSMKISENSLMYLFVAISVLSSFAFVYYGINVISAGMATQWLTTFAYVTAGYGLGNIAILSLAWNSRSSWAVNANMVIGFSYFGVFVIDAVNLGIDDLTELIGILLIAMILWCNWMTIKKVIARP